jgi:hypothetical protein
VVRRGGTTGRRTDSCSANGCQIPQHVSVIVLRADDVTERGLNCQQPLDWAAAGVPQPGDNQPYLRPYHSIVAAGLATTPHATGGFAALQEVLQVLQNQHAHGSAGLQGGAAQVRQ